MVKLSQKGSQDPTDSSLQMKVTNLLTPDQTIPRHGQKTTL